MFYTHYTHYTSYTDYTHYTHVTCVNVYTCVKCVTCVVLLRGHKYTGIEAMREKLPDISRRRAFILSNCGAARRLLFVISDITVSYLGEKWVQKQGTR